MCPAGHRCEVENGEAFCQPDCSLNNGGCLLGQECRLNQVRCARAPCPPVVECIHTGHCNICSSDQGCLLSSVPCLIPPCPVRVECVKPRCVLPADPGPCNRVAIRNYFFNTDTRRCEQFTYGGCFGNKNNFKTLWACEWTCQGETSKLQKKAAMNSYSSFTTIALESILR